MSTVIVFDVLGWEGGTAGRPSSGGYGIEIVAGRFLKVGEKKYRRPFLLGHYDSILVNHPIGLNWF